MKKLTRTKKQHRESSKKESKRWQYLHKHFTNIIGKIANILLWEDYIESPNHRTVHMPVMSTALYFFGIRVPFYQMTIKRLEKYSEEKLDLSHGQKVSRTESAKDEPVTDRKRER
uniref:Uncharacterized protein n=1 Tax=Romanomermis culicivorax TaxID=13658 RepID=A0A915IXQ3_ROMCU